VLYPFFPSLQDTPTGLSGELDHNNRHVVAASPFQTSIQDFFGNQPNVRFSFLKEYRDQMEAFLIQKDIPNIITGNNQYPILIYIHCNTAP
jgi:hypothetical protein